MSASPDIIARFIPRADLSRGPFGLLGIDPEQCDDFSLAVALTGRLKDVNAHAETGTPQAEAVRQALYTAATQLRDPQVRDAMRVRWYGPAWTSDRAASLAETRLDPAQETAFGAEPELVQPPAPSQLLPQSVYFERDRHPKLLSATLVLLTGAAALIGIIIWLISMQPPPPPQPVKSGATASTATGTGPNANAAATITSGTGQTQSVTTSSTPTQPPEEAPPSISSDEAKKLLQRLRTTSEESADANASAAEFATLIQTISIRWTELPSDLTNPIALAVTERLFKSGARSTALGVQGYQEVERPLLALSRGGRSTDATEFTAAIWSAAMLNRIKGDTSLPGRIISSARTSLASLTTDGEVPRESGFVAGALLAIDCQARRTARPDKALSDTAARQIWRAIVRASKALDAIEKGSGLRAIADSAGWLLRDGEVGANATSLEALETLLSGVADWREKNAAETLLAWFDDPRLPMTAMHMTTAWMATRGPLASVGNSMILPGDATSIQRSQLRDEYALRLGVGSGHGGNAVAQDWLELSRKAIGSTGSAEPQRSSDALTALGAAVAIARLNETAARRWAMDDAGAQNALAGATAQAVDNDAREKMPDPSGAFDLTRLTAPGSSPDGEWARKYLAVIHNEFQRIMLINQLRNGGGPAGPVDADVLAEAACFGSPMSVRQLAQAGVRDFASRVEVVNGLLESIADASRQRGVSDMVQDVTGQTLPKPSDPTWRAACRKALAEKLMELTADSDSRRTEALALLLGDAYRAINETIRTRPGSLPPPRTTLSINADTTEGEAGKLWDAWHDQARAIPEGSWAFAPLAELERRHAARASLTGGPIQQFVAEQLGATELMAYVVAGERTSQLPRVKAILAELTAGQRDATSAFHQALMAERAILRLWLIRYGEAEQ